MSGPFPPYALFVLSENVDADVSAYHPPLPCYTLYSNVLQYINGVIRHVFESEGSVAYKLALVTSVDYSGAPRKRYIDVGNGERREDIPPGTPPSVPSSFKSPFAGKTLQECASYMRDTPGDVAWQTEFFCTLDDNDKNQDTIMLVRRSKNEDGTAVHAFPEPTGTVTQFIINYVGDDWEDKMQRYKRVARKSGKEDRSVGVPFEYTQS